MCFSPQRSATFINSIGSFSNSKLSPSSLLRRRKNLRSRSKLTNAKIAASHLSSNNTKMTLLASPSVWMARRSNATMLLRRSSSSKTLPKSLNVSASATRKSSQPSSTQMPPFPANATSPGGWFSTFAASSMDRLTTWSTLCAPSMRLLSSATTSRKVMKMHPRRAKITSLFQAVRPLGKTRTCSVSPAVQLHAQAPTMAPTSTTRKSLQKWNPASSPHLPAIPVAIASA